MSRVERFKRRGQEERITDMQAKRGYDQDQISSGEDHEQVGQDERLPISEINRKSGNIWQKHSKETLFLGSSLIVPEVMVMGLAKWLR